MTGQYRVALYDRNRKRKLRETFVRADSLAMAERIGREILGGRTVIACEYQPWRDPKFAGYVKQVS